MAHLALDRALPASWIDKVFQAHRQRQYPRELLFSSVVELMLLVTLGLRPSLHAAARKMDQQLPVSLAALYAKVQRTEPAVLRALVQGSAERLAPLVGCLPERQSLPGWQLRVLDGNHLPASQKRLGPLRGFRGAALPGHTMVVYDPDSALVCDIVACEDAYESEHTGAAALTERAQPRQVWIGDRHFCNQTLMQALAARDAGFIVREQTNHPRVQQYGPWSESVSIETGQVREQSIESSPSRGGQPWCWRRIEIALLAPTEAGDQTIVLWSNLPAEIDAATIARLYRKRWRIEGMFGRLESVLHSEIKTLGHPRAALLGFAVAVLAYNVLALLKQLIEHAHRQSHPQLEVSTYHLAVDIASDYGPMLRMLPPEHWPRADDNPHQLVDRLLLLASRMSARQLATSKRKPKTAQAKGYVDAATARSHVSTARVLKQAAGKRP
ncbi:IS4 family transposase [Alicycliphilus denitrificans]|jgi:IS4 transposase|uniref:IS4 family transposase n=1 Tax=Alicycliphilus denitrificans TaxID=179636 RepID=UPI003A80A4F6